MAYERVKPTYSQLSRKKNIRFFFLKTIRCDRPSFSNFVGSIQIRFLAQKMYMSNQAKGFDLDCGGT